MAIVYKITNRKNGKIYFGMTTRSLKSRFDSHLSAVRQGSKFRLHSAIRKYGVDCWDLEVIEESEDLDYIRKKEEQLIEEYKTTNNAFGYNAKPGGCGGWIVKAENYETWRENNKLSVQGIKNPRFNGITNDELYQMVKKETENLGYIPSQQYMIKKYHPIFPKAFSKFRFNGSYKNLVKMIEKELGIFFKPYKHSELHKQNLSKSLQGRKWHTNGIQNIQCLPEDAPKDFKPGRTFIKENKNNA